MKNSTAALRISLCTSLLLSLPLLLAQPRRALITQPIDDSDRILLTGNVHPLAQPRFDQGAVADSDATGTLILLLGRSPANQMALDNYVSALTNPSSSQYGHWLTPEEYADRFGASPEDVERITIWLQSQGFTVEKASRAGNFIRFSGAMSSVRAAFGTEIHRYQVNSTEHLANASNPQIPAALAPVVRGIAALNDFRPMPQLVRSPTRAKFNSITKRVEPAYTVYGPTTWGSGTGGYDVYFLPVAGDAAIMYNTPNSAMNTAYHGATWDGSGVSIGIAADSNLTAASQQDIVNYRVSFLNETVQQAAQHMPKIVVDGQDPGMNDDALEAILDIELAQALAPGVTTIMYTSDNTELQNGVFLALQRAVDDNTVNILNLSFQECEQYLGASGNAFLNELYEQAAAQGITVVVAAGDSGSAACDGGTFSMSSKGTAAGLGVNGLASTQWNVAVGGTDFDAMFGNPSQYVQVPSSAGSVAGKAPYFSTALGYIPEEPWNDSTSVFDGYQNNVAYHFGGGPTNTYAAGGGRSSHAVCSGTISTTDGTCSDSLSGYSKPAFQSSLTPTDSVRDVPDVSFFAGAFMGDEGYAKYFNNAWAICADSVVNGSTGNISYDCTAGGTAEGAVTPVGGTSAATPVMAGVLAMVSQSLGGKRLGQVNTTLYNLYSQYPAVFHDITQGNNSVLCIAGSTDCGSNLFMNGYAAAAGYDLASGLGSIDVTQLIQNWGNVKFNQTSTSLEIGTSVASLSTAPLTITHGTPVYIQAAVTPSTGAGNIAITGNSTQGNSGAISLATLTNGAVSFSIVALPGGSFTLVANYGGDSNNAASSSSGVPVTISSETSSVNIMLLDIDPTSGVVSKSPTTIPYGQYLFAEITPYGSGSGLGKSNPATGTVTLAQNGISLGSASVQSQGTAEFQIPATSLVPGSYSFQAQYSGDDSYAAGQGTGTLAVTKAPITGTFASGCGPTSTTAVCMPGLLIATDSMGAAPTGSVALSLNGSSLGTFTVSGSAGAMPSTASGGGGLTQYMSMSAYVGNTVTFAAVYSGDSNYQGGSYTVSYTVPEPANAAIALSNNGPISVSAGVQGTATVTATPSNGFLGPVNLSCSVSSLSGGVYPPTCSIGSSLTITGTAAQTATLTISTTGSSSAKSEPALFGRESGIAFGCLLLCGALARRKAWRGMLFLVVIGGVLLAISNIGCSSDNSNGSGGGGTQPPATVRTTDGVYTVTVTGANGAINGTTAVTLNVQ